MLKEIRVAGLLFLVMVAITGVIYPIIITGSAQVIFPEKASGSIIEKNGKIIGSSLIGQQFIKPEYFHPRPSVAGYNPMAAGASNLHQSNPKLIEEIAQRFKVISGENPGKEIPADLLTSSASGLDPHISLDAAVFQIARIAKARKVEESEIIHIVHENTEGRLFGLFGEPRVNVLLLNLALDK